MGAAGKAGSWRGCLIIITLVHSSKSLASIQPDKRSASRASGNLALAAGPADNNSTLHSGLPDEGPPLAYIAACLVFRDETYDIDEWLEYHRWLGIGKVYLYEHNSSRPILRNVMRYIQQGYADYLYFHYDPLVSGQHAADSSRSFRDTAVGHAWMDCIKRSRGNHRWVMLSDIDEYLMLTHPQHQQLPSLLHRYEQYSGLAVNWLMFSGRPHVQRPARGVLASYTWCYPSNHSAHRHVKLMVHPRHVAGVVLPHQVAWRGNPQRHYTVDELGRRVDGSLTVTPTHTYLALHHYVTRSDEDYLRKRLLRGNVDSGFRDAVWAAATQTCSLGTQVAKQCCPGLAEPDADEEE